MRICVVSDLYYPYPGGVSEHVHHTVRGLRELGHEVTILTTNYAASKISNNLRNLKVAATMVEEEGNIVRVGRAIPRPTNKSMGIMPFGFGLGKKIKEVILGGNFDIIHMHGMSPFLPLLAVKYSKSVNILTLHGSSPEIKSYKYIAYLLQSYIKKAEGVIAVSFEALKTVERFIGEDHTITPIKGNGDTLRETSLATPRYDAPTVEGFISGKLVNVRYAIIPNGIDTCRFSPSVEPISKFRTGKDACPTILFVGRLEPRKGLKYLLQAFTKVREELPDARLIVVGKGLSGNPKSKIQNPNVYFEGYVSAEDIPRYYAGCDVFCSPAICRESFGIVLLEAMSSGKPVIASNIPGYREVVIDGENGLLVEPENPEALASALIKVLTDKEFSKQLGWHGRETALKYSWDKVTREIEKFYVEVQNDKARNKAVKL